LLTDGQETGGGDYELEARKAGQKGFYCQVHIIGLRLSSDAISKAKRISSVHTFSPEIFWTPYSVGKLFRIFLKPFWYLAKRYAF
jgi:hypothetical protein